MPGDGLNHEERRLHKIADTTWAKKLGIAAGA